MNSPFVVLKAEPPLPANVSLLIAAYANRVVQTAKNLGARGADGVGIGDGFIFSMTHVGDRQRCLGTYVGREVSGRLSTAAGAEHKVTLLVDAAQFAN